MTCQVLYSIKRKRAVRGLQPGSFFERTRRWKRRSSTVLPAFVKVSPSTSASDAAKSTTESWRKFLFRLVLTIGGYGSFDCA
jgi:hypothetical protein